jgi:aspartyl-tRNA(Asn)/glutamyl-tRNA(Gln) amidotransferase subunit C
MKLTRDDVLKLARLSRLKLGDEEIAKFQDELSTILNYVEHLDSVNVDGLEQTYQVTGLTSDDLNATREDEVTEQVSQKELLKNVPKTKDGHIEVKRMIG